MFRPGSLKFSAPGLVLSVAAAVFKQDPFKEMNALAAVAAVITAVSLIFVFVPLKLGIKHLNNIDF